MIGFFFMAAAKPGKVGIEVKGQGKLRGVGDWLSVTERGGEGQERVNGWSRTGRGPPTQLCFE